QINQIDCDFSDKLQDLITKRWKYTYNPIMMVAYMLDPQFLEESKSNGIESTGYKEFTNFINKKFNQEESVKLFAELVIIHNKNSNRLKNDRVKKLVYIYGNLRMYNGLLKICSKQKKTY